jgi:hypothetical protein
MANDFKIYAEALADTNLNDLVQPTGSSVYIISSIIVSNTHASTAADIDLIFYDDDQASSFNILTDETFAAGLSREILARPMVLENQDILRAQASSANIFDILVSFLDRSRD